MGRSSKTFLEQTDNLGRLLNWSTQMEITFPPIFLPWLFIVITESWKQLFFHQWDQKFQNWKWVPFPRETELQLGLMKVLLSKQNNSFLLWTMSGFRKYTYHLHPQRFLFGLNPPTPPNIPIWLHVFLKTFAFATHLSLGISIDLLWERYGYFWNYAIKLNISWTFRPNDTPHY